MSYLPAANVRFDLGPAGEPCDDPREQAEERRVDAETTRWMAAMARLEERGMLSTAPVVEVESYLHNIALGR